MFTRGRGLGLSSFRRDCLIKDIAAGLVLTTLLVPRTSVAERSGAKTQFTGVTAART